MKNKKRTQRLIAVILTLATVIPLIGAVPLLVNAAETELYSENFEGFGTRDEGTLLVKADGFSNDIPNTTAVAKKENNTYLKVNFASANDPNKTVHYVKEANTYKRVEDAAGNTYTTDEASYGLISGNDKNLDKNLQLKHSALSYDQTPTIVIEVDYYLSDDAKGTIQSQFKTFLCKENGNKEQSWLNLFRLDADQGRMELGGYATENVYLKKGDWNTISILIDLKNGTADYYLNYALASKSASLGKTNLKLKENSFIVAKIPRTNRVSDVASELLAGCFGVDNVRIYTPADGCVVTVPETDENGNVLMGVEVLKDNAVVKKHQKSTEYLTTMRSNVNPLYFNGGAYEGIITSFSKPAVRLAGPGGMRFVNSIDPQKYAALIELKNQGMITNVEFGTLIAPTVYVRQAGDSLTVDELDKLNNQVNYVKVKAEWGKWYEDQPYTFAGSLTDIKPSHYTDEFAGVGYVAVTLSNGRVQYFYGDYYHRGASIASLADAALKDTEKTYTDEEKGFLNSFQIATFNVGESLISDVSMASNYFFFRYNGADVRKTVDVCITYTGDNGWRIKAQPIGKLGFEGMGAAQALAYYMNEEINNTVLPIDIKQEKSKLTLSCEDGSYVTIDTGENFQIRFYSPKKECVSSISDLIVENGTVTLKGGLVENEGVYGGGERFDTVNKRGTKFDLYTSDGWNKSSTTYMAIPLFLTTRGAGIYVNRYERMTVDFGKSNLYEWSIWLENDTMDCYIYATGDIKDPIESYTKLTGTSDLPEEWSYGVMLCRYGSDLTSFETDRLDENGTPVLNKDNAPSGRSVKTIVTNMINAGMKPTAVVMEAWNYRTVTTSSSARAELRNTVKWLDDLGIKAMVYMAVGGSFTFGSMAGFKEEYLLHAHVTKDGNTTYTSSIPKANYSGGNPDVGDPNAGRPYLDITNPYALEWFYDKIWGDLILLGIDGVKIDFCEQVPDEGYDYGGLTVEYDWYDPTQIVSGTEHHSYPVYFISTFYRRMNELKEAKGETDGFYVLSRGGGIGSQRNPYLWAGDQVRSFDKLDDQVMAVVNSGLSGVPFMTFDMAGYRYSNNKQYAKGEEILELESRIMARAVEFTAFMTNIQTHGTVRNAYELNEDAQEIYCNYTALHDLLADYITKCVEIACESGLPPVRHPVLHYQHDVNVYSIKDQFMLGDALMVAPILSDGSVRRTVYLPEGNWTNLLTGEVIEVSAKGLMLTVDANLGQIPVFLNNHSADAEMLRAIFEGEVWTAIKNWK